MHGQHPHARIRGPMGQVGRVQAIAVPAQPHLQRDRHRDRAHHGVDQAQRMVQVAHQRRPRQPARDLLGRAAHVDVDDPRAHALHDPGGFRHRARLAPGDLHADGQRALGQGLGADGGAGRGARRHHLGRGDHFADHQPGAVSRHGAAERQVGDPRHGRKKHRRSKPRLAQDDRFTELHVSFLYVASPLPGRCPPQGGVGPPARGAVYHLSRCPSLRHVAFLLGKGRAWHMA